MKPSKDPYTWREKQIQDASAINDLLSWSSRGNDPRYFEIRHLDARDSHILWVVRLETEALSWSAESSEGETLVSAVDDALTRARKEGFA